MCPQSVCGVRFWGWHSQFDVRYVFSLFFSPPHFDFFSYTRHCIGRVGAAMGARGVAPWMTKLCGHMATTGHEAQGMRFRELARSLARQSAIVKNGSWFGKYLLPYCKLNMDRIRILLNTKAKWYLEFIFEYLLDI